MNDLKDDVLRLGSPAYPLIGKLQRLGCNDVFLNNCIDDEDRMTVLWRSTEPCRYLIHWRGRADKPVFDAIRSFAGDNGGRVVNFYQVAYPGDLKVTGTGVEFTCPGAGFEPEDPWKFKVITYKSKDLFA